MLAFGGFILIIGSLMLFRPERARWLLRQAGSTNLINYAEITIRLLPGIAMILYADYAKSQLPFTVLGWIIVVTSCILYAIPRAWHHEFSLKSAELLTPIRFQLISPFAFLFGGLVIYNAL